MPREAPFDVKAIPIRGKNHSRFQRLSSIDVCAGLGGFSIAADWLGMRRIAAVDSWDEAETVYKANHPAAPFLRGDITDESVIAQLAATAKAAGGCDLLTAGPPCQGFSQIRNGQHKKSDKRNEVSRSMPKVIRAIKPRAFIIENVPAIFDYQGGRFAHSLLASLRHPAAGLRYKVVRGEFDAAVFGVPQQRRRAFILGVQKGEGELALPEMPDLSSYFTAWRRGRKTNGTSDKVYEILQDPRDDRLVSVAQAFSDLPVLGAGVSEARRRYRAPPASAYQKTLRGSLRIVTETATPRIWEATAKRLQKLRPGQCVTDLPHASRRTLSRKFMSAYRRLHPDLPSTTLFTKIDCAYHPTATRALSVREYARLQSIPDDYEFPVAARHAYAMIGNAVPPLLAARLLKLSLKLN